jgi:predicted site-specific integrase-resolvase
MTERAAMYARVSTARQEAEQTVQSQVEYPPRHPHLS